MPHLSRRPRRRYDEKRCASIEPGPDTARGTAGRNTSTALPERGSASARVGHIDQRQGVPGLHQQRLALAEAEAVDLAVRRDQ